MSASSKIIVFFFQPCGLSRGAARIDFVACYQVARRLGRRQQCSATLSPVKRCAADCGQSPVDKAMSHLSSITLAPVIWDFHSLTCCRARCAQDKGQRNKGGARLRLHLRHLIPLICSQQHVKPPALRAAWHRPRFSLREKDCCKKLSSKNTLRGHSCSALFFCSGFRLSAKCEYFFSLSSTSACCHSE